MSRGEVRWLEVIAVAAGAALLLLVFRSLLPAGLAANESSDFRNFYAPAARSLLAGDGLTVGGAPLDRFPPLYPWLLAAAFWWAGVTGAPEGWTVAMLSVASFAAAAALVYRFGEALWGRRGGIVAAALWASYPPMLWLAKQPNSELPFQVLLYAALALFWQLVIAERPSPAAAALCGTVVGLAALTRSIAAPLGLVLAIAAWRGCRRHGKRTGLLVATALLAGNAVVIVPWHLWLRAHSGRYFGSAAAHAMEDGLTFAVRSKGYRDGIWTPERARRVMASLDEPLRRVDTVGGIVAALGREATERPLGVAELYAFKTARALYGTDSGRFGVALAGLNLVWLAVVGMAAWRCRRLGGAAGDWAGIVALAIGFLWLMTLAGLPLVRYVAPALALGATLVPALATPAVAVDRIGSRLPK